MSSTQNAHQKTAQWVRVTYRSKVYVGLVVLVTRHTVVLRHVSLTHTEPVFDETPAEPVPFITFHRPRIATFDLYNVPSDGSYDDIPVDLEAIRMFARKLIVTHLDAQAEVNVRNLEALLLTSFASRWNPSDARSVAGRHHYSTVPNMLETILAEENENLQALTARRTRSPHSERLHYLLVSLRMLFFFNILFGCYVTFVGGSILGTVLTYIAFTSEKLVLNFEPFVFYLSLIPGVVQVGLGVALVMTASFRALERPKSRRMIVGCQVLVFATGVVTLVLASRVVSTGKNVRGQTLLEYWTEQAKDNSHHVCNFQFKEGCTGFTTLCGFDTPRPTFEAECPQCKDVRGQNGNNTGAITRTCGSILEDRVENANSEVRNLCVASVIGSVVHPIVRFILFLVLRRKLRAARHAQTAARAAGGGGGGNQARGPATMDTIPSPR